MYKEQNARHEDLIVCILVSFWFVNNRSLISDPLLQRRTNFMVKQ